MTEKVLEFRRVSRSFGAGGDRRTVLRDVDLSVAGGEVVALFGRSGSGKSALLTIAAGLDAPDSGEVLVSGRPATTDAAWHRIALLPQALGLLDELTVEENVSLPLVLAGEADEAAVDETLERLSLAHLSRRLPSEISLGEQQRTALARAVIVSPSILIADEPVSHQNPALAQTMIEAIAQLAEHGTACLIATHDDPVVRIAHRVVQLRDGQVTDRSSGPGNSEETVPV
ncbi:ABC transporter ATP-binding protein [Actinospongicola halichondriae]|uniref:ABC transporter ATP-binding protein n=1 Tax=Actinospongicola halichondriae TaxID=3236844 RepID=UPI003D4FC077